MKSTYISFLFCVLFASAVPAQELYLDGGKSVTTFKFKDILANELEDLQSTNHSYIDIGYRGKLLTKAILFVGGFGVHSYGASGNDTFGNYLNWETTYASLYAGIDAEIFNLNAFSFHLKGTVGPEIMLQGTQTLNNEVFDVLNAEDFDTPFVFLRGAASFEYSVSESIAVFFQYRYGRGSQINNSSTGAELKYITNDYGVGLIFKLKKKNAEEKNSNSGATKK